MNLFRIREGEKEGFINAEGEIVITPSFAYVFPFSEGLSQVQLRDPNELSIKEEGRNSAFINTEGEVVIPPGPPRDSSPRSDDYAWSFHEFSEGLAQFWVNDATGFGGFMDTDGVCVIPSRFKSAGDFSEGLASASLEDIDADNAFEIGAPGFIDSSGDFVIEPNRRLRFTNSFSEGYCVVDVATSGDSDELSGYIDRSGEIVIPAEFTIANDFSGGLARVQRDRNGPFGFIGYDGSPSFTLEFDDAAAQFSEGVAYFRKGEEHMILDRNGTRIGGIDIPSFDGHIGSFSEGLADVAVPERRGLFRRRVSDRCGFIRPSGEVAIPLKFDWVFPFEHGLARVREGKTVGYINHDGDYVWSTRDWEGY